MTNRTEKRASWQRTKRQSGRLMQIGLTTKATQLVAILALTLFANVAAAQELRLPNLLSDHAVLQAHRPIVIWGWGAPDSRLDVTLGARSMQAQVDETGRFAVAFPALSPSYEPLQLLVSSPEGTLTREDILIGDVWLAGGQSNMVWELEDAVGGREESVTSDDPYLRLFEVPEASSLTPRDDVSSHWVRVRPRAARRFSAVGYFFGKTLRQQTDVPVGIVQVAYGGTRIEAWTPAEEIATNQVFEAASKQVEAIRQDNARQRGEWIKAVRADLVRSASDADPTAWLHQYDPPVWPGRDVAKNTPTALFSAMLDPVLKFPSRGMIWYQGESNRDDGVGYADKLRSFISVLRTSQREDYPIGIVQIAPVAREQGFQEIWQAQLEVAQGDEQAGLIVTTDLAELRDIHPRRKREVGERLSNWALNTVYGRRLVPYSGPLIKNAQSQGDRIRLTFDHSDDLNTLNGGPLTGFVVLDHTGRRLAAEAEIVGRIVVLNVDPAFEACTVEYQMRPDAFPTLTNASGLPASPFRKSIADCEQPANSQD